MKVAHWERKPHLQPQFFCRSHSNTKVTTTSISPSCLAGDLELRNPQILCVLFFQNSWKVCVLNASVHFFRGSSFALFSHILSPNVSSVEATFQLMKKSGRPHIASTHTCPCNYIVPVAKWKPTSLKTECRPIFIQTGYFEKCQDHHAAVINLFKMSSVCNAKLLSCLWAVCLVALTVSD